MQVVNVKLVLCRASSSRQQSTTTTVSCCDWWRRRQRHCWWSAWPSSTPTTARRSCMLRRSPTSGSSPKSRWRRSSGASATSGRRGRSSSSCRSRETPLPLQPDLAMTSSQTRSSKPGERCRRDSARFRRNYTANRLKNSTSSIITNTWDLHQFCRLVSNNYNNETTRTTLTPPRPNSDPGFESWISDFRINPFPDVRRIAPKMLWTHYLIGVSHFAKYRKNRPVTVWEMAISLLKSPYSTMVRQIENWSGIRIRNRIITKRY